MRIGLNSARSIVRRGVLQRGRAMSHPPAILSPPESIGGNRLAAPSPTETCPPARTRAETPPPERRSGWLRPSVIIAGLAFLGLVLGGSAVTDVAGSDSVAASYVNQLGQLVAAVIATAAS